MARPAPAYWYYRTVSALVYSIIDASGLEEEGHASRNAVVNFVLLSHARMPDFLRLPMMVATLAFDWIAIFTAGRRFHKLPPTRRKAIQAAWRRSPIGPCRDLIRFYESLATLAWASGEKVSDKEDSKSLFSIGMSSSRRRSSHQVAVLGSGPGGSITAAMLAEKGYDVVLIEEGSNLPLESCIPFSVSEMVQKYRNGGLTPAMGSPKVAYVEGATAGGGSEINSGLYHRTPPDILAYWNRRFQLQATEDELKPHFEACERDVNVGLSPGQLPKASLKLQEGADKLGWRAQEVPRWFAYDGNVDAAGIPTGHRQSMTRTFLQRFTEANGAFVPDTRAQRIVRGGTGFEVEVRNSITGVRDSLHCENLFVSCGAIGTPALLQRSGIPGRFGQGLQMHPTVKVVAEFDEEVNAESMGVPVHQVKEFAPGFSFGCSISSKPYLALALLDHPGELLRLEGKWKRMAVYYAMVVPKAEGSVRTLPGFQDPLVRFQPSTSDLAQLSTGLRRLCELLFAAGAVKLYPSISGFGSLHGPSEISRIPNTLPAVLTNLMTIHLFSSCRMGEDRKLCPVDSYGRVHGMSGLHIADASLLPSAPGVNPQGSLMAFARRNVLHFIDQHNRPI